MPRKIHLDWKPVTQQIAFIASRGRRLGFVLANAGDHGFGAVVLEVGENVTPDELLDDHAHDRIGPMPTMEQAKAACQEYANAWVRGDKAKIKRILARCGCESVAAADKALRRAASRRTRATPSRSRARGRAGAPPPRPRAR